MRNKTTLRQVPQGVVATIDERPKLFDYYYELDTETSHQRYCEADLLYVNDHTIIASTFGVGKELVIEADTNIGYETIAIDDLVISIIDFNQPYEYTETETSIIVNL
jgi:hypothetical protein